MDTKVPEKSIPESGPWTPQIKNIKNVIIGDGFTSLSHGITQFENIDTLILAKNSYAEKYCKEKGFKYETIDEQ